MLKIETRGNVKTVVKSLLKIYTWAKTFENKVGVGRRLKPPDIIWCKV